MANLKIKKQIWLLGWTSLINDMSSEMILPILPMFLQSLGASGLVISVLGGLRAGLANVLKMFFGYLSDKLKKRKLFIVSGYVFSSFCKVFLAFSKTWVWASCFALLERIGKGLRNAARDALIADYSVGHEGVNFGFHRMMDTFGAICGSLVVLLLYWKYKLSFSVLILLAGLVGFLTLIPLFSLKDKPKDYSKNGVDDRIDFELLNLSNSIKIFLMISAVFSLGELSYMLFILRVLNLSGPTRYHVIVVLLFYIFFNIFYAVGSLPFGILFDKLGGKKVILVGYILMMVTSLGFFLFIPMFGFLLFALYGLSKASLRANRIAFMGQLSPESLKATSIGIFQTIMGCSMIIGSVIAGIIWDKFSLKWTFLYAAIMHLMAIILLIVFWKDLDPAFISRKRHSFGLLMDHRR